jgi:hypothetical protein
MKSQSLKFVVLAFFVGISSLSIVAQDQPSTVDKQGQSETKALVQSATTKKKVKAMVASAKTPEDHMRLATYFNQEADRLEADARDHEELAKTYRLYPSTAGGGKAGGNPQSRTAEHCDAAVKSLREAAKSLRELAAEHEQMANDASKSSAKG